MSAQDDAKKLVDTFAASGAAPGWLGMNRATVAAGLKERIDDPDKIDQGSTSLCGPADFVRDIATDRPVEYAQAAIDLFKTGRGHIGRLQIKAGVFLRTHVVPATAGIHQADWIVLASIRDSDNWFFDYQSETDDAAAITMPHSKEKWLKQAGYSEVINDTNVAFIKDLACATRASGLFSSGYKVALFINANMLYADKMNNPSLTPDHWVALASPMRIKSINLARPGTLNEDPTSYVTFSCYSWGKRYPVPASGTLTDYRFCSNYYGFIACRR
jgi:hypothetical protein